MPADPSRHRNERRSRSPRRPQPATYRRAAERSGRVTLGSDLAILAGAAAAISIVGAVLLHVGAAIGSLTPATEVVITLAWLIGWACISGAGLLAASAAVTIVARGGGRGVVAPVELALVLITVAVVVGTVWAHAPWGAGGATGSGL
jgi:hypothetical protein